MVNDVLLLSQLLAEHFIVNTVIHIVALLNAVAGKSRMVTSKSHLRISILKIINPSFHTNTLCAVLGQKNLTKYLFHSLYNALIIVIPSCLAYNKMVIRKSRYNPFWKVFTNRPGYITKKFISLFKSIPFVV